jgi:hypothetical protein
VAERGYLIRLRVPAEPEALDLASSLTEHGALVTRDDLTVSAVWPATEADDPEEWDEYTFAELIFFLRAWAGRDPARTIEVLEERPVTLHDHAGSRVA